MIPYWLLFAIPTLVSFTERPRAMLATMNARGLVWVLVPIALMIGLRWQVGGDWGNYARQFERASGLSFSEVFTAGGDPGFVLVNWIAARLGGDIWLVNLACGALFVAGLGSLLRGQPRPWLGLVVAIPYLIIVVAMGYSRQAVAIGFAMLAFVALTEKRSTVWFAVYVLLAASFHKTAILLFPIAALTADRGRLWAAFWLGAAALAGYVAFLSDSIDRLWYGYVEAEYDSQGALIRTAMNALPALIFLAYRRKFAPEPGLARKLWTNVSLVALFFVVLLVVSPSSTAVDRLGLYIIPLQLFVLGRLPDALGSSPRARQSLTLAVIGYSAAVQFVWLTMASHAQYWLPYQVYFI